MENSMTGRLLSDEESTLLTKHLLNYMKGDPPLSKELGPELGGILADFIVGLTFPSHVDIGPHDSKRWMAFFVLSSWWNNPKTKLLSEQLIKTEIQQDLR